MVLYMDSELHPDSLNIPPEPIDSDSDTETKKVKISPQILLYQSEQTDLIKKEILIFCLHHSTSVLSQGRDNLQDVHLSLLVQLLHGNLGSNEHTSATNTSTTYSRQTIIHMIIFDNIVLWLIFLS